MISIYFLDCLWHPPCEEVHRSPKSFDGFLDVDTKVFWWKLVSKLSQKWPTYLGERNQLTTYILKKTGVKCEINHFLPSWVFFYGLFVNGGIYPNHDHPIPGMVLQVGGFASDLPPTRRWRPLPSPELRGLAPRAAEDLVNRERQPGGWPRLVVGVFWCFRIRAGTKNQNHG